MPAEARYSESRHVERFRSLLCRSVLVCVLWFGPTCINEGTTLCIVYETGRWQHCGLGVTFRDV